MEIIRGVIPCAKKVVIYGPEGIGKSTFASRFPDPVFIDTEGSTNSMDVARLPKASSWQMLLDQVDYVRTHPTMCKTLVIDTIDWAESMCIRHICDKHRKSGIEDFGYGNGYVYVKEELGKFLNQLTEVVEAGVNVVLTAHAQIRKFEQPDELGAYDRWELKLGKKTASQTSPLIKEWADMLLFANYKTFSIAVDDKGKKRKAQGGERVMYTTHNACWDAKNRYGLPDEVPFSYDSIRTIIEGNAVPVKETQPKSVPAQQPVQAQPTVQPQPTTVQEATKTEPAVTVGEQMNLPLNEPQKTPEPTARSSTIDPGIPKALRDLMENNQVDEWDIQNVVAARGYYPSDVKIKDYDMDFINGCLMGPPSDKQKQTLEKLGIMPDQIENAGKAAKILDRLDKRRNEGLTTPKQIRFLEGRGFKHVGTWQFNTAKNLIDRIAGNGWKIPNDIVPQEYKGA